MKGSYAEVLERADDELQSLAKSHEAAEALRQATQDEISSIQTQESLRNNHLADLRKELAALEERHDVVELEHRLAAGTDLAGALSGRLKQLVGDLRARRREVGDLEKNTFAEEAEEAARLQALHSQQSAHEQRLADIGKQIQAAKSIKEKTFAAQGEAEFTAMKGRLAELTHRLQQAKLAEQEAHAALLSFADEAKQRLQPWPAFLGEVAPLLLYEDATTRILALAIQIRDALVEQGKSADIHLDTMRAADMWGSSLAAEITMEPRHLWPAVNQQIGAKPEALIEQKRRLEKLLAVYVNSHR